MNVETSHLVHRWIVAIPSEWAKNHPLKGHGYITLPRHIKF